MRSFKENPQLLADPEVRRVLGQLMGLSTGSDNSEIKPLEVADVMKVHMLGPLSGLFTSEIVFETAILNWDMTFHKTLCVLQKILLTPSTLQYMTCHDDELNRILIPSTPEDGDKVVSSLIKIFCEHFLADPFGQPKRILYIE